MSIKLDSKIPSGPVWMKWTKYRQEMKLVNPANKRKFDIIVVGTGLAGASAAATLGELGYNVKAFCFQDSPRRAHSIAAQGGINAAKNYRNDGDSVYRLFYDTIKGGDFRAREANVHRLAEVSVDIIDQCVAQGVPFAREYGGLLDNRSFGGAQVSRTFYARGQTGQQLLLGAYQALSRQIHAGSVKMYPRTEMLDIVLIDGHAKGIITRDLVTGRIESHSANTVVLATGGYAKVFRETTNVPGSTGDGVAAAWRAGASLTDLEFVQFHPTTLYLAGVPRLLLTEAIRGEGGWIVDDKGRRFLVDALPEAELAPRDEVSRAILRHLQRSGVGGVFLDLTHLDGAHVAARFPGVAASCRAHGLDIARDRIPVRPAAHYSIGGVRADAEGRTDVPGLFAAGEVAATGLHGANRLASNSLLEGLVLGGAAGRAAARHAGSRPPSPLRLASEGPVTARGFMDLDDLEASLRALLWREAGIERSGASLTGALAAVEGWEGFAHRVGSDRVAARLTLLGMLCVARMLCRAALTREESRGTHHRRDFPSRDDGRWRVHLVHRRGHELERVAVAASVRDPDAAVPVGSRA